MNSRALGFFVLLGCIAAAFLPSGLAFQAPGEEISLTFTEGTNFTAVASPDRQFIAIDVLGMIWVLPMAGGAARPVTPQTLEARNPAWGPDSKSLTFQAFDEDNWHIHSVQLDGSGLRALTSGLFDDEDPEWSPDGQNIVFSSDRFGDLVSVWQVAASGGAAQSLSRLAGRNPCWIVNDVGDRTVTFLGPPPPGSKPGTPPAWWVVGVGGRETLLDLFLPPVARREGVVTCASGRTITTPVEPRRPANQQLPSEDVFPFRQQWLSGGELLYTADGHIKRRRLGQAGQIIPFQASLTFQRPSFKKSHRALQADGPSDVLGIVGPVVSPDGSRIAFAALGDLWVMPIGAVPVRVTNDAFVELDPSWSPDGRRLAFSSDRSGQMELWVHDFTTGAEAQLTKDAGRVRGAAWSPDGREIAFRSGRGLLKVPATGAIEAPQRVGTRSLPLACGEPRSDGRPTWAPAGAVAVGIAICYAELEGTNQLAVFPDNQSPGTSVLLVHHSAGNRQDGGPVWSPDGSRLAYVSEGRLWTQVVDPQGRPLGNAEPIAEDTPRSPSWEGDSRRLVYLAPGGLRRASVAGGTPEPIGLDLRWLSLPPPDRVVVHAGTLFDGQSGVTRRAVDVVVERGRILDVSPHNNDLHTGRVIDASEQTVMPGLIDAYARLDPAYGEALGRIYLAYGVTTVRDHAPEVYAGLEMRESWDAGRRMGPRLFMAGAPFDGLRIYEAGGTSIGSAAQLGLELDRALRLNFDVLATRRRLADTHEQSVAVFGHEHGLNTLSSRLWPAVALGTDGLAPLRERLGRSRLVSGAGRSYRDVIDLIARSRIAFTPALGPEGSFAIAAARDRSLLENDPRLRLFAPEVIEELRARADLLRKTPALFMQTQETVSALGRTVQMVNGEGGLLAAGSGAPSSVPYGLGLHIELEQFVKSGLSPSQALLTATRNAAEALGVLDELGTIERGKLADLIVVDGNPLEDIRATRDVRGVMRGGWYYDLAGLGIRP